MKPTPRQERLFKFLKGMAEKGTLEDHHVLNAEKKEWITHEQAEELMALILTGETNE